MIPEESPLTEGPILRGVGIELESETRIVIGRLRAPSDPARPWWWQSSTKLDENEIIMAGLACSENDAILEAAARTMQLRLATER